MNQHSNKPTFKSAAKSFQEKAFNERHVGAEHKKRGKNRPHFNAPNADSRSEFNKKQGKKPPFKRADSQEKTLHIAESTMKKAGRAEGGVKVMVKSSQFGDKPREKKTGPLSPRAPEKIKKNRAEEMKVYGENACLVLFEQRPGNIVRLWATVQMAHKIGDLCSYLAANKKAYHIVENDELTKVSGTEHHGGICMLVKKSHPFTLQGYLDVPHQEDCLVLLDGVNNAQNLGGILRTCAFFGVKNIVVEDAESLNSAATLRVAEGGAEYVRVLETDDTRNALAQLRHAGYQIIHVSSDKNALLLDKVRLKNKTVFVLSEGSTDTLANKADEQVRLSFGNPLKNGLNVSVNAGILLAKWYFR
ncbi:tRNA/rRNA methyltransferase [Aggregatibacter actinomycetemcomitans]|uniref:tRNA/rRNA methyltransferase n=1 Tax=Aggregatibacter actinomycetemcomitans TaxID=714 RepID=UPI00197C6BF3|nr:tRNA/rRNA methyltransferase [Aggregatibacter actinomycetemcomitans]MBN6077790.1 tRNA/rRNA methyltransferase [Aggregatibacter actinomycetemcomitans]